MAVVLDYILPTDTYAENAKVQFEFDSLVSLINTELATLAPVGATYVTLSTNTTLTNERVLTGTSNQIVVTDNGAGSTVVLSTPQNIHTAATPTFASETLTATSNQLILGTTRTVTLTAPTPASTSRVVTFPDLSGDYSVVGTTGTQTITGTKTFAADTSIEFSASGGSTDLVVSNTSNTSGSAAVVSIKVAGTSADDPYMLFQIPSGTTWGLGVDNSDSDSFKIDRTSTTLGTGDLRIDSSLGAITQPSQPCFLVTDGTGASNVTGDNTAYTELWPTEVYDIGSNFASNTFTAPITGKYFLSASVGFAGMGTAHTRYDINIVTSNRTYRHPLIWASSNALTNYTHEISVLADMDASDTATVSIVASGGTKVVDVINSATDNTFSGSLIN